MIDAMITIDNLIEIVKKGGKVKTGVDVYNAKGTLLLERNVFVEKVRPLEIIKENGIQSVPLNGATDGGLWDETGRKIEFAQGGELKLKERVEARSGVAGNLSKRLQEIEDLRKASAAEQQKAKACLKNALDQMQKNDMQFDVQAVESRVKSLSGFLNEAGHPFGYLNRQIFNYDEYLFNHSINVCAIGTAVLNRFNTHFSSKIDQFLFENQADIPGAGIQAGREALPGFTYYYPDELDDITLGYFLYDIGKIMIPHDLLNKKERLTPDEFEVVKRHSYDFGLAILEKNRIQSAVLKNIIAYHHAPLFEEETGCYPEDKRCGSVPLYVKICKLADIYDAMTSKTSYKEALNQISAVTEVFRKYVRKDPLLQFILHAFVKSVGICPPGSIVFLKNGQMAYVLESEGPLVIPFTDKQGSTLKAHPDPMDLGGGKSPEFLVDSERSVRTPKEVYDLLPGYLKQIAMPA